MPAAPVRRGGSSGWNWMKSDAKPMGQMTE